MEPCQGRFACFAPLSQISLRFQTNALLGLTLPQPTYPCILFACASSRIQSYLTRVLAALSTYIVHQSLKHLLALKIAQASVLVGND